MIYAEIPLAKFKSVAAVFGWKRTENRGKDIVLRRIEEVMTSLQNTMKEHSRKCYESILPNQVFGC